VSGTTELPIETLNELREQTSQHAMKVRSRDVWKWPEWQEFAARLGIPLTRHVTGCVVHLDQADVVRVSITYIPWNVPCPAPPADTHHTDSSEAEQKPAHHQPSGDTTATGHDSEACS
jgi:hypothetical protein